MPKFLYPGHKYLGPGNSIDNGSPVDTADEIARNHDIAYENATSKADVYIADNKAIVNFVSDFIQHPNLPSAAGAVGIGIKAGLEQSNF